MQFPVWLLLLVVSLFFFYNIYWIDPILTVLISLYIIRESWQIVKEALTVLMMAAPTNISLIEIEKAITDLEGIINVHHIHFWRINEKDIHFEAHIEVEDILASQTEKKIAEIEKLLHEKFEINHVTIQFESDRCSEKSLI